MANRQKQRPPEVERMEAEDGAIVGWTLGPFPEGTDLNGDVAYHPEASGRWAAFVYEKGADGRLHLARERYTFQMISAQRLAYQFLWVHSPREVAQRREQGQVWDAHWMEWVQAGT